MPATSEPAPPIIVHYPPFWPKARTSEVRSLPRRLAGSRCISATMSCWHFSEQRAGADSEAATMFRNNVSRSRPQGLGIAVATAGGWVGIVIAGCVAVGQ